MLWRGPMGGGAASGRIGAMVASHCAQGQYLKSRVKPVNPRAIFQQPLRNALKYLAPYWTSQLTPIQRAGWSTYAANTPWVNRLGDTVHLSGQMEFCRSNWPRLAAGMSLIADAPTIYNRGEIGDAPTLTLAPADPLFTLTLNPAAPWIDGSPSTAMNVYLGIPRPGGITFLQRRTRFVDIIPSSAATGIQVFSINWRPLPDYNQMWGCWVTVSMQDGRLTTPLPLTPVFTGLPPPPPWSDDFAYPDGPLAGQGDWFESDTSHGYGGAVVISGSLSTVSNTDTSDGNNSPNIISDWHAPWSLTTVVQRAMVDDSGNYVFFSVGSASQSSPLINLWWNAGDGAANNLHNLIIAPHHGTPLLVAVDVPWTTAAPHTLTLSWDGTFITGAIDGVIILNGTDNSFGGQQAVCISCQNGVHGSNDNLLIHSISLSRS